jgi:hypothetical protein
MAAKASWVKAAGAVGEDCYCERCGEGLSLPRPIRVEIWVAATKAFAECHSRCEPGKYFPKPPQSPEEWAAGRDTGTSSFTIYGAITGRPIPRRQMDIPYDPDDFGRCYRLLKLFPAWREQLPKVAEACPRWEPFVAAWDELTALYEAAGWHDETKKAKSDGGKMYQRMKELEQQSRVGH